MQDRKPTGLPANPSASVYQAFMSDAERAKDYSDFSPASFEQRVIAWTIDILILGIFTRIVDAILGETGLKTTVNLLVFISYFMYGHQKYQRTLGKHLMGLRIVSMESGERLTTGRLFLRDILGRSLCGLTLGLGYLLALVSEDRRAMHDYFGKTKVVSLKPVREVALGAQLARGFGILVGLATLLGGGFYYRLFYTAWPLERLQQGYYAKGVRMKGITGSLTRGFTIKRIDWEEGGEKIEFEDLFIDVEANLRAFADEDYHIRKISIARANVVFTREENARSEDATIADESVPEGRARQPRAKITVPRLRVDEVDLNNMKLDLAGRKVDLRRFFLSGLVAQGKRFALERVYVDSQDVALSLAGFSWDDGAFKTEGPVQLVLRQGLFPEALRADLDLNLEINGTWPDVNLEAVGFRQKLKVRRQATLGQMGVTQISVSDWSPGHYLRGYWPIHRLSLRFDGRGDIKTMLLTTPVTGQMNVQHIPYRVGPGQTLLTVMTRGLIFEHQRGAYTSQVAVNPMLMTKGGWFRMASTLQASTPEEEFAYLYFGQPMTALDEARKNRIQADLRFFNEPLIKQDTLSELAGLKDSFTGPEESPSPGLSNVQHGPLNVQQGPLNVQRGPSNESETAGVGGADGEIDE